MGWTSVIGLASCAFVAAAALLAMLPITRRPPVVQAGAALACIALMLIPIDGLIIAGYVRGVIGDPSVTTMILFWCLMTRRLTGREIFDERNLVATMGLVLFGAVFLYPMAMGFGPWDPYALGFASWPFILTLLLIALLAWWRYLYLPLLCIVLGMVAFAVGLFEATNLWNYLIDPIAVMLAAGWAIERGLRFAFNRYSAREVGA